MEVSDLQINMGKEFYNANVQILLKKIQYTINHYSMYSNVMKASIVERINRCNYVKKRYVETIYAQCKLQMDRLAIAFSVAIQRAKVSNYRYAAHRCDSHVDKLLNTLYSSVKAVALPRFKVARYV